MLLRNSQTHKSGKYTTTTEVLNNYLHYQKQMKQMWLCLETSYIVSIQQHQGRTLSETHNIRNRSHLAQTKVTQYTVYPESDTDDTSNTSLSDYNPPSMCSDTCTDLLNRRYGRPIRVPTRYIGSGDI